VASVIGNRSSNNEDCLYLNVYTPQPAARGLPVMVWIHGGGFVLGAGSDYDGSALAAKGNLIVVTINYRLGPFGFLALKGLANEDPHRSSGDYGIEDQQAALRWVKANIARFGGDPRNVTIFGESAGAGSVCLHVVSPQSAGLFDKAIAESGPCTAPFNAESVTAARSYASDFAARPGLDCTGTAAQVAACMRAQPTAALVAAMTPQEAASLQIAMMPNVDGYVLPQYPADAIQSGQINRVPMIEGSNLDEGRLFIGLGFDSVQPRIPLTAENYADQLEQQIASASPQAQRLAPLILPLLLNRYPLSAYPAPPGYDADATPAHLALSAVLTDSTFSCPSDQSDRLLADAGVRLYAYEFSDPNPPLIETDPLMPLGAAHGTELLYVFQAPIGNGALQPSQLSAEQLNLSDTIIRYWTNFARYGDPNEPGLPHWPRYGRQLSHLITLAPGYDGIAPLRRGQFVSEHQCLLWSALSP
jgi:para-nitrobenzyl esterase